MLKRLDSLKLDVQVDKTLFDDFLEEYLQLIQENF